MIVPIALGVIGIGALLLGRSSPKPTEEPYYPPVPGPTPGPYQPPAPKPTPSPYQVPTETQALYMAKLRVMGVSDVSSFQSNWNDGGYSESGEPPYRLPLDGNLSPATMQAIDEAARYYQSKQGGGIGPQIPIDFKPDSPPSPFPQYQGQEIRLRERPIYY